MNFLLGKEERPGPEKISIRELSDKLDDLDPNTLIYIKNHNANAGHTIRRFCSSPEEARRYIDIFFREYDEILIEASRQVYPATSSKEEHRISLGRYIINERREKIFQTHSGEIIYFTKNQQKPLKTQDSSQN